MNSLPQNEPEDNCLDTVTLDFYNAWFKKRPAYNYLTLYSIFMPAAPDRTDQNCFAFSSPITRDLRMLLTVGVSCHVADFFYGLV